MDIEEFQKTLYRPKKIAVCVPWSSPFIWMHTAFNLMNLKHPKDVEVTFINGMGRDPGARHMWGVKRAIEIDATHICFLGADQLHPMDILEKLCAHVENGWPIVTARVPIRGSVNVEGIKKPFQKVAWKWKGDERPKPGEQLSTEYLQPIDLMDGPYQEIVCIGTGVMLFDVNLLYALKKPWFREAEPDEDGFRAAKMDTGFSYRLVAEAQGRMLCDLTIDVLHLDVFPIDETYGIRFGDWTTKERAKYAT